MRILPNILFLGRGLSVVWCRGGFDYKVLVGEGAVEGEFGEHLVDVPMCMSTSTYNSGCFNMVRLPAPF